MLTRHHIAPVNGYSVSLYESHVGTEQARVEGNDHEHMYIDVIYQEPYFQVRSRAKTTKPINHRQEC